MHVCFFCNEYPRPGRNHGGIGRKIQVIARRFVKEGHRVSVIGLYPSSAEWEDDGVRIHELPEAEGTRGTRFLRNRRLVRKKILRLMSETGVDLFEFQDGYSPMIPLGIEVPVVVRFSLSHSYFAHVLDRRPRFFQARLERFFLPKADAFASCSRYVAEVSAKIFGLNLDGIRILPNPIELSMWELGDPAEVEEDLILFTGSVHWVKGARELAKAFLIVRGKFPNAHLVYMGRDRPLPDRPGTSYVAHISEMLPEAVRPAVEFIGHQPREMVRQWLHRAAVVALPSFAEGHSNAVTEAQATGKAIVLGARGSASEVLKDGISGLLCEPSDPGDIAEKICSVLGDRQLRDSLGREARRVAEARFSIDVLYPKNLDFYESVVSSNNPSQ